MPTTAVAGNPLRQDSPHRSRTALTAIVAASALLGCTDPLPPEILSSGTFFGPTVAMAGGTGRAYVTRNRNGVPSELGVAFTEEVLNSLPVAMAEYVFALPPEATATRFRHAVVNWMPIGHPPATYSVPHFDFHFYTITDAERAGIVLGDSVLAAKLARQPALEFLPSGYATGAASIRMGLHWRDLEAPEFTGQPFTKAYIYGSYDGAIIFGEPMIAKAYLETKPAVVTPLKLPAKYAATGYQATSYTIAYDAATKEYRVALSGFAFASGADITPGCPPYLECAG
jgi:hypothetical protein